MPVYIVTGKLGSGKTLAMVGRIRDYLRAGKPVATNISLNPEHLAKWSKAPVVWRLADRPTVADLEAIGTVHSTGQEEKNGALVLDECGAWLNARTWSDKGRATFVDWMLHSRKKGWDVYLIVQSLNMIDKQIREGIGEYTVICRRLDRLRIPGLGRIIEGLSFGYLKGTMPKVHVAAVRYGNGPNGIHADTWYFRGRDLYGAFETVQVMGIESPVAHQVVVARPGAKSAARSSKPKLARVQLLMKLPSDERLAVAARWSAMGLLGECGADADVNAWAVTAMP